jgi:hypothetical protein
VISILRETSHFLRYLQSNPAGGSKGVSLDMVHEEYIFPTVIYTLYVLICLISFSIDPLQCPSQFLCSTHFLVSPQRFWVIETQIYYLSFGNYKSFGTNWLKIVAHKSNPHYVFEVPEYISYLSLPDIIALKGGKVKRNLLAI